MHSDLLESVEVDRLSGIPLASFDCGRDDQNHFFREQSWTDQVERLSTTYTFQVHGVTAAFATICMDALPLSRRERGPAIRYHHVSALKLAQLGVDRTFQGEGIGRAAVSFVLELAYDIGENVGCRYVTLDAQPELEEWYAARGFVKNRLAHEQRVADAIRHQRDPAAIAVSMRFDLRPTV
jgi:GNAT superfamily N-acetyltransferase